MRARFFLIAVGVLVAICVGLWFLHPIAPLLIVLSLAVQLPVAYALMRKRLTSGYLKRTEGYRKELLQSGDANAWLCAEQGETLAKEYSLWHKKLRLLNLLNRAEALAMLGQKDEVRRLLQEIAGASLPKTQAEQRSRVRSMAGIENDE